MHRIELIMLGSIPLSLGVVLVVGAPMTNLPDSTWWLSGIGWLLIALGTAAFIYAVKPDSH